MARIISLLFKRGNLLVGLMLIVFVVAGPAFAVLVNLQRELRRERETQASLIAEQRAHLLSASVGTVVEGTRQMMVALSFTRRLQELNPACGALLDTLRRGEPAYELLAVVRGDGSPVCSSAATPLSAEAESRIAEPLLAASGFTIGRYSSLPLFEVPVLSFALPFVSSDGNTPALLIAAYDVRQLQTLLESLHQPADGRLVVADQDGTVLASAPKVPSGNRLGQTRRLIAEASPGVVFLDNPDGSQRVVSYVPAGSDPGRLFVEAGFNVADLVSGIDAAANRGYLLILLGAALSLLLALFVGHRYLRAPASVLLDAARRWGSGDLAARAAMPDGTTVEFAALGTAFNEMAQLLQHQRSELQGLNDALEIRVAERTRALLDSNNRLQVEIAERELTEASLRQAQKLQAVGQLAGGMAHDFNNLLTAILGSLELLRKRVTSDDGRQIRLIDTATAAVERGAKLTSQLLAFSRKQPLLAVSIDVAEAIQGMGALLASTLGAKTRLQTRVDEELWPALLDPNQFEAALLNLALNARDAMPAGGRLVISAGNVAVTPASAWSDLSPGDYVCVTVADSGVGMSAEVVGRAFEPFFTTKPPGTGSGLGLSQVHGMVRQSGGSVTIESRPGDGTKVVMMMPRSAAGFTRPDVDLDLTVPALRRGEKLLLVDDDDQVRGVTEAVLTDAGYTVLTAPEAASAILLMEAQGDAIGVVIADYAMPGMTGRELLQVVTQRWPGTAILLATGYADYPELIMQDLPIDQIVRKPFRSNELLARIHMVVGRVGRSVPETAMPAEPPAAVL